MKKLTRQEIAQIDLNSASDLELLNAAERLMKLNNVETSELTKSFMAELKNRIDKRKVI